jgi:2,4-diketo-3-deoxy-L-fuconate hydrolase
MKLVRFGEKGLEKPGVLSSGGEILDVSGFVRDYDEAFFASDGINQLANWLKQNESSAPRRTSDIRLGAPVARPSKIICIGLNYSDHAKETNAEVPAEPVLFMKASSSQNGPNDPIEIPRKSHKTDWEVELAVVIGKRAKYVEESDSLSNVAGYMLMNDVSEREFQIEHCGQWVKGKSHDTFSPMGPWLVTPDEIADVQNLSMHLYVNGERMQNGSTSTMVFGVRKLVSYISQFMTLLPGDVISTGTPPGVGMGRKPQLFLKPGDVVELDIEGLGNQRQECIQA